MRKSELGATGDFGRKRIWVAIWLVASLASLADATTASADEIGWAVDSDALVRLRFSLADGRATTEGSLSLSALSDATTRATALPGDGSILLALSRDRHSGVLDLVRLDPASGAVDSVASLPAGVGFADLSVDSDGLVWFTNGALHRVDVASGLVTPVSVGSVEILAIATRGEELFAVIEAEPGRFQVVLVELAGPDLEVEAEFFLRHGCFDDLPAAMDFDSSGGLWIAVLTGVGCLGVPAGQSTYYRYLADLSLSTSVAELELFGVHNLVHGLAIGRVDGLFAPEDIPAGAPSNAAVLATLIALSGIALLIVRSAG